MEKLEAITIGGISLLKIIYIIIIIVAMLVVMKVLVKASSRVISRSKIEKGFHKIIIAGIKFVLYAVFIIIIAGQLGIEISSLVAMVSVAGAAVALAAQSILANIFDGMILMAAHPYKVDDYIDTGAHSGTVVETGLFYTKLRTVDNKVIFISNSDIFSNRVVNYTTEKMRRADLTIGASYDATADQVRQALLAAAEQTPGAVCEGGEYAPAVYVGEYGDYSVKYIFRVWCRTEDYWNVYFGLMENARKALGSAGIDIPLPKMDVRVSAPEK